MFDSELVAILKALQWVEGGHQFKFVLLSDSVSALRVLKGESGSV